jgi:hypothetical protein
MSQEQLIRAVAAQVAAVAGKQGCTSKDVLADMQRYLLKQRLNSFVARHRADAEAMGIRESDVDELIHQTRRGW